MAATNDKAGYASQTCMVEIQGLTKSFGSRFALKGVDLEIGHGEFVVIFGPNGAGKTTLVKVLSTIMRPSSGKILVDGLELDNNAEEIRRRIGVVTHQTFLYGNLTGYENLTFYGRMYDIPRPRERIQEVADMVGMTSRLHDRVGTLSRGMQQRLSIARSLLHKPALMLLDEPETGLDQQAMSMVWKALQKEGEVKRSILLTTHNLERGLEMGERLLILDRGTVVYQGLKEGLDLAGLKEIYEQSTRAGG